MGGKTLVPKEAFPVPLVCVCVWEGGSRKARPHPTLVAVEPSSNNTLSSLTVLLLPRCSSSFSCDFIQLFCLLPFTFLDLSCSLCYFTTLLRSGKMCCLQVYLQRVKASSLPCEPLLRKGCLLLLVAPSLLRGNHWCGVVCNMYPRDHLSARVWCDLFHSLLCFCGSSQGDTTCFMVKCLNAAEDNAYLLR